MMFQVRNKFRVVGDLTAGRHSYGQLEDHLTSKFAKVCVRLHPPMKKLTSLMCTKGSILPWLPQRFITEAISSNIAGMPEGHSLLVSASLEGTHCLTIAPCASRYRNTLLQKSCRPGVHFPPRSLLILAPGAYYQA
jgi:hypothetical protein